MFYGPCFGSAAIAIYLAIFPSLGTSKNTKKNLPFQVLHQTQNSVDIRLSSRETNKNC